LGNAALFVPEVIINLTRRLGRKIGDGEIIGEGGFEEITFVLA
jgi:hypothetical protein